MRRSGAPETLGDYVREARQRANLRLRELAGELGITPSYLSDIENDRRVPSQEVLEGIARRLHLDLDELLARAGRLDPDTERYLRRSPAAVRLFRRIAEHRLDEADLKELEQRVERLGQRRK